MRRPSAQRLESVRLRVYRRIIRYYLRYALVRCAKFTNRKAEAQTIAFYTLVTTCLLAPQIHHARHLGTLVDMMVRVVARDQIRQKNKTRQDTNTPSALTELLLADETMRNLAQAMNMLDGFARELLVLYHIELIAVKQLSQLFGRPQAEIKAHIAAGQKRLASHLQKVCSNPSKVHACDVALLLDEFRAYLGANSADRLAKYALSCVAQWEKDSRPAPPCCNFN